MFNVTHVSPSSSAYASTYRVPNSSSSMNHPLDPNQTNQLGLGLGRLARMAFDHMANTLQNWWNKPSAEQIATQKRIGIFRHRVRELIPQLESAFVKIRRNPNSPDALKRIQTIAADSAQILVPHEDEKLRAYQTKQFKQLEQRISTLQPFVKDKLRPILPMLFPHDKAAENKEKTQSESTPLNSRKINVNKSKQFEQANPQDKQRGDHTVEKRSGCTTLSYDLNALTPSQGFAMTGPSSRFAIGSIITGIGDINGDGKNDFAIGTYNVANPSGAQQAGAVTIIFGGQNIASVNLANLTSAQGFVIYGEQQGDNLGTSIVGLGNFAGSGNAIAIGAPAASASAPKPKFYVLFGPLQNTIDLSTLNGTNGFKVNGQIASQLGNCLAGGGDVNGDGRNDVLAGAPGLSVNGTFTGGFYGLFGQPTPWPAQFNVTQLDGNNGFAAPGGSSNSVLGYEIAIGNIDGVSPADFVVADTGVSSAGMSVNGLVYAFTGHSGTWTSPLNLNSAAFTAYGPNNLASAGTSLVIGGDLNHDGKSDIGIGTSTDPGNIYMLYQQPSSNPFNLGNINGTNGINLQGIQNAAGFGTSAVVIDINNDGNSDLAAGMYAYTPPSGSTNAGGVVVVLGQPGGLPTQLNLANLDESQGFIINGIGQTDNLGASIANLQDVNGDGLADLGIIAPGAAKKNGLFYVLFGQNVPLCTTSPSTTSPPSTTSSPSSSPTNLGAIVGAVVGGVVVIAGVAIIVLLLRFKKRGCFAENNDIATRNNDDDIFRDD